MKKIVIANWKMNPQKLNDAKNLFNEIKRGERMIKAIKDVEVIICPPFVFLASLKANGSQDCFWQEGGAYTGEISPIMLKNLGVKYVILGHSERRRELKETNQMISKKVKAVMAVGLKPILCIDKVSQIPKNIENLIIAYEPLFAIGTGRACSWERAKKMKDKIQKALGKKVKILYGGSVNSQNAESYIKKAGFDGLLIGGASLNPKEFIKIIKNL